MMPRRWMGTALVLAIVSFAAVHAEAICGDGVLDAGEVCDGTDFGGLTCARFTSSSGVPYAGGQLSCQTNCSTISTAQCGRYKCLSRTEPACGFVAGDGGGNQCNPDSSGEDGDCPLPEPIAAEILTIFSDAGFPSDCTVWADGPAATFKGKSGAVVSPEGYTSWETQQLTHAAAWWGTSFTGRQRNLSRYGNGELRFWVYADRGDIRLEIKGAGSTLASRTLSSLGWTSAQASRWVPLRMPLSAVDLTSVEVPVSFVLPEGPATFYIDNVRYVESTTMPIFRAEVRNRSDHSPSPEITWRGIALPAGWVVADQYILLTVDADWTDWGVQIYSDNKAADANPAFTGPSFDPHNPPAGLVNQAFTDRTLPLAWSIRATLETTVNPGDPDTSGVWFYVVDPSGVGFSNGTAYQTLKNHRGIHFEQGSPFGEVQVPPNPIYLAANFGLAVTPSRYRTSTLRLEFYRE